MPANIAVIDLAHDAIWNRSSRSNLSAAPWRRTPVTPLAVTLPPRTTAAARPESLCFARTSSSIHTTVSVADVGGACSSVREGIQPFDKKQPNPPRAMRRFASRRVILDSSMLCVLPLLPKVRQADALTLGQ